MGIGIVFEIIEPVFMEADIKGDFLLILLDLGVSIFVGSRGNEWRNAKLKERGFKYIKSVEAETPEAAIESITSGEGINWKEDKLCSR